MLGRKPCQPTAHCIPVIAEPPSDDRTRAQEMVAVVWPFISGEQGLLVSVPMGEAVSEGCHTGSNPCVFIFQYPEVNGVCAIRGSWDPGTQSCPFTVNTGITSTVATVVPRAHNFSRNMEPRESESPLLKSQKVSVLEVVAQCKP